MDRTMLRPMFRPMVSWAGLLIFVALSMQAIEKTTFRFPYPWALMLFRIGFLSAGVVLLLRFISFRSQKPLERMIAAYTHAAGSTISPGNFPLNDVVNLALYAGVVIASLCAIGLGWDAQEHFFEWRNAILLDGLTWVLIWTWAAKACWLRAQRKREILKMSLDDLRSRQKPAMAPQPTFPRPGLGSKLGFFFLLGLGISALASITFFRMRSAPGLAAKTSVAGCMEPLWIRAKLQFEHDGNPLLLGENPLACLEESAHAYDAALTHDENGVTLSVWESRSSDGFGDGVNGDQGLRLSTEGKLLEISRSRQF